MHHRHHQQLIRFAVVMAGILAVISGCTRPTSVSGEWHTDPKEPPTFKRLFVVGVTTNANRRRSYEDYVVASLRQHGNKAWASHMRMDIDAPLTRESIGASARAAGADAILVTRLVSRKVTAEEVQARTRVKPQRKQETPLDFFRYDYTEYEEPAYVIPKNTVVLSTDLYQARDTKLIYSIRTTTYEKETIYDIIEEVSRVIVDRLRREALVQ